MPIPLRLVAALAAAGLLAQPAAAHEPEAGAAVAAAGLAQAPGEGPRPADGYFEVLEPVAEGVWVIRQEKPFHLQPIGNVTIIEQSDGLVLVDGGGSPGSARRIAALVRRASPKPVKALVLTHWHGDHSLGFGTLKALWPQMQVIATATTRDRLRTSMASYAHGAPDPAKTAEFHGRLQGMADFVAQSAGDPAASTADRKGFAQAARLAVQYRADTDGLFVGDIDRTFTDGLVLEDSLRPVQVFHPGRGNTDGDAAVWVKRERVLVTGDLLVAPIPFGFNSYPRDWLQTIDVLLGHDFAVLVPGHGAPQRDPSYAVRVKQLIETVRARVASLAAAGATLEETRARVDLSDQAALFVGDDPWLRRWFRSYWADPFIEAAWKEAKGMPIEQGQG